MRVAAGAVAQKILGSKITIKGALTQIGKKKINPKNWNWEEINKNDFFFVRINPLFQSGKKYLKKIRKEGSSIGAIIQINAKGIPIGLGEPVFDKVEALLAKAIMSIPAVKGFEIGSGFKAAELRGEENADEIEKKKKK